MKDSWKFVKNRRHPGKKFFIILATIVLAMAGVGIAGEAVAGEVEVLPGATGEVKVTAGQALTVIGGSVTGVDAGRVIVNDDAMSFLAPAEVYTGDKFTINLALGNKSGSPMEAQIDITGADGFTVKVEGRDGVHGVVQVGAGSWVFVLDAEEGDEEADLAVTIKVNALAQPGYYNLGCLIEPLAFGGGE